MVATLFVILKVYVGLIILVNARTPASQSTLKCIQSALTESFTDCSYPSTITSSEAIQQLRDKWIVFMGESTLRQIFLQFLGIIKSQPFDHITDQKGNSKIEERLSGSRYTFLYHEYYQNLTDALSDGPPVLYDGRRPDLLILNDGLHDLLYAHDNIDKAWNELKTTIIDFTKRYKVRIMWIPPPQIHDQYLTKHRKDADWFNNDTLYNKCISEQRHLYSNPNGFDYYYDIFRNISFDKWNFDGIHNMQRSRIEAEGLIRTFYHLNKDATAWMYDPLTTGQIMTFLFYTIICIVVTISQCLKYMFYRKNKEGGISTEKEVELFPLIEVAVDSNQKKEIKSPNEYQLMLPTVCNISFIRSFLLHYIEHQTVYIALLQFALCLVLLYLFDGPQHMFISPSLKLYSRDFFIFLHVIFLLISYLTFTKNTGKDEDKILSRLQSEEWKGIMQIVFVMYHYFDAAEIYNMIRVFIGAYVWMTGYGNTLFFVKRNIFNLNRLFGMLFRLNWLVFWVCLLLNQSFMLYYICPLHTFFFLFCYCTWGIAYHLNDKPWVKEIKLAVSGLLLCVMFETDVSIFNFVWNPLWFLLNFHGTLYEWHFRTTLDHYATWMGMVFAVYYEPICKWITVDLKGKKRVKAVICAGCLVMMFLWYEYVYRHDKFTYNAMHPYTESIPIFCYIILRNVHDGWRGYYSVFLAWMGQITLESYIFQYHLYMVNDAKSILTVIPNYPLCNFMIVSVFYVWMSRIAFNTTNTLRNALYPPRSKDTNWVVCKRTFSYLMIVAVLYVISRFILFTVQ
eukprot:192342_1